MLCLLMVVWLVMVFFIRVSLLLLKLVYLLVV